jgi:glycosyltransferase involved in cell wall biosynthesis
MHILQVTPYYPPAFAYGGIPRIVHGLSNALHKLEHRISVLTTDVCDADRRVERTIYQNESGINVWSVPNLSNRLAYQQQLYLPLLDQTYFDEIERSAPIDIIHLHGHRHLLNNLVLRWAKKRGIPYVFTANGTLRRHEQKVHLKWLWDKMLSGSIPTNAAACIAVSNADRTIHTEWGIAPNRIHTIPNGLALEEFSQAPIKGLFKGSLNIPENAPLVVYLGRISPRKGVDILVRSFKSIQQTSAHLIVAGSDMGGLQRAKDIAQQHPRIHFVDTVEGDDRLALLQDADVLVYPSQREIFGLVPFEGLMMNTPVIVSDDCGCGEIIQQANAGKVVPYGNVQKLTLEIDGLLSTPSVCRAMVKRGRSYIEKHFAFDVVAQQHADLYHKLHRL